MGRGAEVNKQVQILYAVYFNIFVGICVIVYSCICVFVFVYLYLCLYLYQCHHDAYNEGGREAEMNKQGRTLADVPRSATACLCDCEATAAPCDL